MRSVIDRLSPPPARYPPQTRNNRPEGPPRPAEDPPAAKRDPAKKKGGGALQWAKDYFNAAAFIGKNLGPELLDGGKAAEDALGSGTGAFYHTGAASVRGLGRLIENPGRGTNSLSDALVDAGDWIGGLGDRASRDADPDSAVSKLSSTIGGAAAFMGGGGAPRLGIQGAAVAGDLLPEVPTTLQKVLAVLTGAPLAALPAAHRVTQRGVEKVVSNPRAAKAATVATTGGVVLPAGLTGATAAQEAAGLETEMMGGEEAFLMGLTFGAGGGILGALTGGRGKGGRPGEEPPPGRPAGEEAPTQGPPRPSAEVRRPGRDSDPTALTYNPTARTRATRTGLSPPTDSGTVINQPGPVRGGPTIHVGRKGDAGVTPKNIIAEYFEREAVRDLEKRVAKAPSRRPVMRSQTQIDRDAAESRGRAEGMVSDYRRPFEMEAARRERGNEQRRIKRMEERQAAGRPPTEADIELQARIDEINAGRPAPTPPPVAKSGGVQKPAPVAPVAPKKPVKATPIKGVVVEPRGFEGENHVVRFPGRRREPEPVTYKIVEAETLTPEIRRGLAQQRDRSIEKAYELQVQDIKNPMDFDPVEVGLGSGKMTDGAPTYSKGGVYMIGGNGRADAIYRSYKEGIKSNTDAYEAYLVDRFGYEPGSLKQPVLVREFNRAMTDKEVGDLAKESNISTTSDFNAAEAAKNNAETFRQILRDIPEHEALRPGAVESNVITSKWLETVPTSQKNKILTDGKLSEYGALEQTNGILRAAYGEGKRSIIDTFLDRVAKLGQQASEYAGIKNAMVRSAAAIARLRQRIADGEIAPEYDIHTDIGKAVSFIFGERRRAARKNRSVNINRSIQETDIEGGSLRSEMSDYLASKYFYRPTEKGAPRARAGKMIGDMLTKYVSEVLGEKAIHAEKEPVMGGLEEPARSAMKILEDIRVEFDQEALAKKFEDATGQKVEPKLKPEYEHDPDATGSLNKLVDPAELTGRVGTPEEVSAAINHALTRIFPDTRDISLDVKIVDLASLGTEGGKQRVGRTTKATEREFERARDDHGTYETLSRHAVVEIAGDAPLHMVKQSIRHELLHVLSHHGALNPAEVKVLTDKYGSLEGASRAFETSDAAPPAGKVGRVFAKVINLFHAMRNAFRGMGFKTAKDIFDAVDAGTVSSRYDWSSLPTRGLSAFPQIYRSFFQKMGVKVYESPAATPGDRIAYNSHQKSIHIPQTGEGLSSFRHQNRIVDMVGRVTADNLPEFRHLRNPERAGEGDKQVIAELSSTAQIDAFGKKKSLMEGWDRFFQDYALWGDSALYPLTSHWLDRNLLYKRNKGIAKSLAAFRQQMLRASDHALGQDKTQTPMTQAYNKYVMSSMLRLQGLHPLVTGAGWREIGRTGVTDIMGETELFRARAQDVMGFERGNSLANVVDSVMYAEQIINLALSEGVPNIVRSSVGPAGRGSAPKGRVHIDKIVQHLQEHGIPFEPFAIWRTAKRMDKTIEIQKENRTGWEPDQIAAALNYPNRLNSDAARKAFKEADEMLTEYFNDLTLMASETGGMKEPVTKAYLRDNEFYFPLKRVGEELHPREAYGGRMLALDDPMAALISHTRHMVRQAVQAQAAESVATVIHAHGGGKVGREVHLKKHTPKTIENELPDRIRQQFKYDMDRAEGIESTPERMAAIREIVDKYAPQALQRDGNFFMARDPHPNKAGVHETRVYELAPEFGAEILQVVRGDVAERVMGPRKEQIVNTGRRLWTNYIVLNPATLFKLWAYGVVDAQFTGIKFHVPRPFKRSGVFRRMESVQKMRENLGLKPQDPLSEPLRVAMLNGMISMPDVAWQKGLNPRAPKSKNLLIRSAQTFTRTAMGMAQAFEIDMRLAEVEARLNRGDSPADAAAGGRTISGNFGAVGRARWIKQAKIWTAFMRAGVAGTHTQGRNFIRPAIRALMNPTKPPTGFSRQQWKEDWGKLARGSVVIGAATILAMMSRLSPLYNEMTDDEQHRGIHVFIPTDPDLSVAEVYDPNTDVNDLKGRVMSFTLPIGYGARAGGDTLAEILAFGLTQGGMMEDDATSIIADLYQISKHSFPYQFQPVGIMEGVQQIFNYDSYTGRPIDPRPQADAHGKYSKKGREWVTALGRMFNFSPERLDHMIDSIGRTGSDASIVVDKIFRSFANKDKKIRWFLDDTSLKGNRVFEEFYDIAEEATRVSQTFSALRRQGRATDIHSYLNEKENLALKAVQAAVSGTLKQSEGIFKFSSLAREVENTGTNDSGQTLEDIAKSARAALPEGVNPALDRNWKEVERLYKEGDTNEAGGIARLWILDSAKFRWQDTIRKVLPKLNSLMETVNTSKENRNAEQR